MYIYVHIYIYVDIYGYYAYVHTESLQPRSFVAEFCNPFVPAAGGSPLHLYGAAAAEADFPQKLSCPQALKHLPEKGVQGSQNCTRPWNAPYVCELRGLRDGRLNASGILCSCRAAILPVCRYMYICCSLHRVCGVSGPSEVSYCREQNIEKKPSIDLLFWVLQSL